MAVAIKAHIYKHNNIVVFLKISLPLALPSVLISLHALFASLYCDDFLFGVEMQLKVH